MRPRLFNRGNGTARKYVVVKDFAQALRAVHIECGARWGQGFVAQVYSHLSGVISRASASRVCVVNGPLALPFAMRAHLVSKVGTASISPVRSRANSRACTSSTLR